MFTSNEADIGNACSVSWSNSVFCLCIFLIFVDNQPNVNEVSRYFQHSPSTVWQQNIIQLSETSTADVTFWSQSLRMKAVGYIQSCHFAPMLKKNIHREKSNLDRCVLGRGVLLLLCLLPSPHWKPLTEDEVDEAGWGKVSKPKKEKNYCRLATPAHNFCFAYCCLARLNRHIARERSNFIPAVQTENGWLTVLFFTQTLAATSHWMKARLSELPLVLLTLETLVCLF